MPKNNFLLVDLNEPQTKKLAETITSETSRKILNYLADKEHGTEAQISKELALPISTVHYHLQKLLEASLLKVEEFHYSPKGREVNHYQLANKYIIITPQKISGLKEKLRGILPVLGISLGIAAVIKIVTSFDSVFFKSSSIEAISEETAEYSSFMVAEKVSEVVPAISQSIDIALWFAVGSVTTVLIYVIFVIVKEKYLRKRS
ncbi:helix-turn-helix domain-containing protein [Candidatus Woesearchaeota archaeon]|nr:helix-turn-helix domain-containing protein [Candidatus Woesearchaeota archaeon]